MNAALPYMIAMAGPSCAGKTETAREVAKRLNAEVIALDSYYLKLDHLTFDERCQFNFDEPASIDEELLVSQLRSLADGNAIEAPVYDFGRYTRATEIRRIEPAPFVLIEGLFVLHWNSIRELCHSTVYVDAPDEVCLERRQKRDIRERGRTVESVVKQYNEMVRPMAEKYVWPSKAHAGLVVSGTDALEHCTALVLGEISANMGVAATALPSYEIR